MQLSEIVRRSIVVPKNEAAQRLIETDQFSEKWINEYFVLPVGGEFASIYTSGLFQEINTICGSHIGDYAEEAIQVQHQNLLVNLLNKKRGTYSQATAAFCEQLINLCTQANERQMPLYFVL